MGGRGAISATNGNAYKIAAYGDKDIKASAAGASFSKLPANLQKSINDNLKMSQAMKNDVKNGSRNKMTDEWTTGFVGNKIKVVTAVKNGQLGYTVKKGNKILIKDATKERAANTVAAFYLQNMSK